MCMSDLVFKVNNIQSMILQDLSNIENLVSFKRIEIIPLFMPIVPL